MVEVSFSQQMEIQRDKNLPKLWQIHQDAVRRAILKFSFINLSNYDDYFQEAFIYAWKHYKYWAQQPERIDFDTWLYLTSRRSVMEYRCKLLGIQKNDMKKWGLSKERVRLLDDMGYFDRAYEVFEEGKVAELKEAIESLPVDDRKVIRLFLDDEDLREIALKEGKARYYYTRRLRAIVDSIRKDYRRYFDEVPKDIKSVKSRQTRPVIQYDLDGNFVKRWDSGIAAEKHGGFVAYDIKKVAEGDYYSHLGYRWAYEGEEDILQRVVKQKPGKPVMQLKMDGTLVKIWNSATEAEESTGKFNQPSISACTKGLIRQHKGYRWVLVGETNPEILTLKPKKSNARKLLQISASGEIVREFPSIKAATETGFCEDGLYQCIKGKRQLYKGFKWQYAS